MRPQGGLLAALMLALAVPGGEQETPAPAGLKVGDVAPEFTLPVSTREGIGKIPARLRDFRGQTVVLAFFYKARTGG